MPIYEYQCEKCGQIVENWQKVSDPPLERCESCGGPMKKLISQTTFQLKGSGWYVTDYKKGSSSSSPAKEKSSASTQGSKGEKSSSAKKESKAAA